LAGGAPAALTFGLRMSDGTPIPAAAAYVFFNDVFILSGCLSGGRCGYTRLERASLQGLLAALRGWMPRAEAALLTRPVVAGAARMACSCVHERYRTRKCPRAGTRIS
jgi:hypothetical protein